MILSLNRAGYIGSSTKGSHIGEIKHEFASHSELMRADIGHGWWSTMLDHVKGESIRYCNNLGKIIKNHGLGSSLHLGINMISTGFLSIH